MPREAAAWHNSSGFSAIICEAKRVDDERQSVLSSSNRYIAIASWWRRRLRSPTARLPGGRKDHPRMGRMRFLAGITIAFSCCAAAAMAGPSPLPPVKEWKDSGGQVVLSGPVSIAIGAGNPADRFAAEILAEEIRLQGSTATLNAATATGPHIVMGRPGQGDVDRELTSAGLAQAVPERPESYLIHIGPRGVLAVARDAAGLYYGAQTLRQLMRPARAGIAFSSGEIRDWPELPFRGLSVDAGQGVVPTEAQMQHIIQTAAEYKLNVVSFYLQHLVAFRASPLLAPPDAELDGATIHRLVEFATRRHVTLLPQQQTFGHLHHLLKHEIYSDLGEVPRSELDGATIHRLVEFATRRHVTLLPQQQTFGHLHHLLKHEIYSDLGEVP